MDSMTFRKPIYVGHLVITDAELTYVGRTSMEVRVEVQAESPFKAGDKTNTNLAYVVYVAIDENGEPRPVPPLMAENEAQARRMEQARQRQEFRKQQQAAEQEIEKLNGNDT
jgi:acyl-CoA hydrolase